MTNPVEAVETAIILAIQDQLGHDIVHFDDGQWWFNGCHGPLLLELKPVRVDALQALKDNVSDAMQHDGFNALHRQEGVGMLGAFKVMIDAAMKEETDG